MAEIRERVSIQDGISAPLRKIEENLAKVCQGFEELNDLLSRTQPTGAIEKVNKGVQNVDKSTQNLEKSAYNVGKAIGTWFALSKIKGFIDDCTASYNTQINAVNQLSGVLGNMGGSQQDFNKIVAKASEIQSRGIYGDEAMIGAGAEFATYFTDSDAITKMMDTLSNYAMGMTGGGEVGYEEMINYATNLGKIATGSFDAMTKKGFEFSDAQKAIIKGTATASQKTEVLGEKWQDMTDDMMVATVIADTIDESWAGLYETMSNTPEGKIIQLRNAFGDIKEVVGGQLYGALAKISDIIMSHWDVIENLMNMVSVILTVVIEGVSAIMSFLAPILDWMGQNTELLVGIVATLGVIIGLMTIINFLTAPYTLIILAIVGGIALIVAGIDAVVKKVNAVTGSSYTLLGVLSGGFMTAIAFVYNAFLGLLDIVIGAVNYWYGLFQHFANFFANVFNDPIGSIVALFYDLQDTVLGVLESIAKAIDKVFGSNLADTVAGWRVNVRAEAESKIAEKGNGTYKKVIDEELSLEGLGLNRMEYGEAWKKGNAWGDGVSKSLSEGLGDLNYSDMLNRLNGSSELTADNTGSIADTLAITEEELKYMKDIAEQEAINKFTTGNFNIEMNNANTFNSGADISDFYQGLGDLLSEQRQFASEGI